MGFGAPSATPCLAGFFALRCFSLITIWVTPESWVVKPITSLPHWFYTRILRVPKCFSPQAFSLTPKSAHNLGVTKHPTSSWIVQQLREALDPLRGSSSLIVTPSMGWKPPQRSIPERESCPYFVRKSLAEWSRRALGRELPP